MVTTTADCGLRFTQQLLVPLSVAVPTLMEEMSMSTEQHSYVVSFALCRTFAWIGGLGFTFLIGQSADSYGYDPLFIALAGLDLVGAVVLWVLLRSPKKPPVQP